MGKAFLFFAQKYTQIVKHLKGDINFHTSNLERGEPDVDATNFIL
jgi:hypothetical protein